MPTLSIDIQAKLATFQDSLGRVERQVGGLAGKLDSAFSGLTSTLGALAGAAGVAALTRFVQQGIDAADALDDVAQKSGIAVESLSALGYAAKIEGINVEAFGGSITKLNVNLQAAAQGSKEMQLAFAAVGISASEINNIRPDEAFRRIAEAFANLSDGSEKSALAVRLFGKSGADLIPLLNGGAAGLSRAAEEARRFGLIVSSETAAAAGQFNDNLARLKLSAEGLGVVIGTAVLPSLTKFTEELLAGVRIFDGFASAIYNIGFGIDPFKSLGDNLRATRQELDALYKSLRNTPVGDNRTRAFIEGRIDTFEKRLEFLKLQERQAIAERGGGGLDARDLRLQASGRPSSSLGGGGVTDSAAAVQAEVADGAERGAKLFVQIYLDQFNVLRQQAKEVQTGLMEIFEAGNRTDAAEIERQASALEALLSGTRSGQEASAIRDIETLNNALIVGKLSADQYEEAYALIEARLNSIRGISTETFEQLSNDGTQALRDLQFAVEGWGRNFTNTLTDALETGKVNFAELVRSILRDLVRLQVQQSITRPLFNALSGALGNFNLFGGSAATRVGGGTGGNFVPYGGGRATGGGVTAGVAYTVGERGPELFIPRANGTVMPNGSGGGITQVFNIAPGVDQGAVYRAAAMGASMAKSDIARSMRIGEIG
jgi:hypothetical protein